MRFRFSVLENDLSEFCFYKEVVDVFIRWPFRNQCS